MRYRFKGLNEYVKQLEAISNPFNAEICVENAVTKGSAVVADMTRQELEKLPVDNRMKVDMRTSITNLQKQALIASFGVTPIQVKNGIVDRKTGVDRGYNKIHQPNIVIARSLEKGTSFMPKNAVFSRASRKARTPCINAMQESLTQDIETIKRNNYARLQRSKLK